MLNMVKVPKLEVNVCRNAPCKSKARALTCFSATFYLAHKLMHSYKWLSVLVTKVVAKVLPCVVHIVHWSIVGLNCYLILFLLFLMVLIHILFFTVQLLVLTILFICYSYLLNGFNTLFYLLSCTLSTYFLWLQIPW